MSEKEQQFERIYKETENFGRTQFVREIQMQINDNKKKDKEIERLNKKIEQYENPEDMTLMFMWCDEKAKDEIKRLNNIINEFNKLIENEINESKLEEDYDRVDALEYCLATLQELKGSDKE